MPMDQQLRDLAAAVGREATTVPLTQAGLARLQDLVGQLSEVLSTAARALDGRVDLTGDLWPEAETEDEDEEAIGMDQHQLLTLIDALDTAGVLRPAREDAVRRAEEHFGSHAAEGWELRDFAQQLKRDAPHFFTPPRGAAPPTGAPAAPQHLRRPVHRTLTPEEVKSLEGLSPTDRLTKAREMQSQPEGTRR